MAVDGRGLEHGAPRRTGRTTIVRKAACGFRVGTALTLTFFIVAILVGTLPRLIGYEPFVVLGGSMVPSLHSGDLVVVAPTAPTRLGIGDVITFQTVLEQQPVLATHRIVAVAHDGQGVPMFQTRGDANPVVDPTPTAARAVLGRVVLVLPALGYVVTLARERPVQALLIAIPCLAMLVGWLNRRRLSGATGWGATGAGPAARHVALEIAPNPRRS